jgi:hypothetical protein
MSQNAMSIAIDLLWKEKYYSKTEDSGVYDEMTGSGME